MKKVVLLQLKGGCKKRDDFLQPPCFCPTTVSGKGHDLFGKRLHAFHKMMAPF